MLSSQYQHSICHHTYTPAYNSLQGMEQMKTLHDMVMAGLMDLINWRYRLKTISALH